MESDTIKIAQKQNQGENPCRIHRHSCLNPECHTWGCPSLQRQAWWLRFPISPRKLGAQPGGLALLRMVFSQHPHPRDEGSVIPAAREGGAGFWRGDNSGDPTMGVLSAVWNPLWHSVPCPKLRRGWSGFGLGVSTPPNITPIFKSWCQ